MNQLLRKIFYAGTIGISLFEILNVYFIMPMPGSQEMRSIDLAYFLYSHRWFFRIAFGIMVAVGLAGVIKNKVTLLPALSFLAAAIIIYLFNFRMNAESMFRQPEKLTLKPKDENMVGDSSLVICVGNNGKVKAYPVKFMSYHHQVKDTVGELPLIITYCNVCRTGRAYLPVVNGHPEKFRLVGMDHYNAMFEDETTGSWWRQSTGEAVAGPLKGQILPETASMQMTVKKLFELYPDALVMQPDMASISRYDTLGKFEKGKSTGRLTRTDTLSWEKKSWVVGVQAGSESKAYDWNYLKKEQIINDRIGHKSILLALAADGQSFIAFERPSESDTFMIRNDTLITAGKSYDLTGRSLSPANPDLKMVKSYQEFWHSWQTFHPRSEQFR